MSALTLWLPCGAGAAWGQAGKAAAPGAPAASPLAVGAAATMDPMDAARAAAKRGEWETAADAFADALFEDPDSKEARVGLRLAAERVLEQRTGRIQHERMKVLYELGLAPAPPEEEKPPEAIRLPTPVKIGPPTPERLPRVARRPRRPVIYRGPVERPPLERVPTPADREMARFLYYQGLKAYAENELEEARQEWRKALELDPTLERAQNALDRIAGTKRK